MELSDISRLAKGGASQLALTLLTQHQPAYDADDKQWMRWERVRVRIMEEHGSWAALAAHLADYPAGLPDEFRQWGELRHANALIHSGEYVAARRLLRELIWAGASGERLRQLRAAVMQSYLEEGRIDDAYAAMLRYQQDYETQDGGGLLLRGRVLLAAKHPAEALVLLQRLEASGEVEALRALAALRSAGDSAALLAQAREAATSREAAQERWLWYGVMAEAAQLQSDSANLIIALERMLPLEGSGQIASSDRRLFALTVDQLWQGYLAYADRVGNREQLLLGDDATWLAAAEQTDVRYPVRKRSLYALLALRGATEAMHERAHQALLGQYVAMEEEGLILLRRLYLESQQFSDHRLLPQVIAYHLVDEAIKDGELRLASSLLQQLPQPPGDTERFAWQMRRVKVFLLAGDFDEADALLSALMPNAGALSDEQRDQLVQLLFDLQAVNEHERAYRLLAAMYDSVPSIKLRRELLFWMADSRKAQAMHTEAARLYLQSATLDDNNSMDPWAQTARYQAAKSLAEAGLKQDATYLFQQLLQVTESAERRAVLRHELQQLRLRGEAG